MIDEDQVDHEVYRQELLAAIECETTSGKLSQEDIADAVTRAIGSNREAVTHTGAGLDMLTDMELEEVLSETQRANMQAFRRESMFAVDINIQNTQRLKWFSDHGFDEVSLDLRVQVSIYAVDRKYGGPQEGGWFYDWYQFVGVSERVYPEDVEAAKERLLEMFKDEQPRYPIDSCASDGPEYRALTELRAGDNQTRVRPHYE